MPKLFSMSQPLQVLAVIGSLNQKAATRAVILHAAERLRGAGCQVDVLDFSQEPLGLFDPEASPGAQAYPALKERVDRADVYLLGTPDYHGSMSGVLKNFLDHFWQEIAGKLFASVVASYEKGLTVTDQIRTVARQCYAWSLPYGVSFADKTDVSEGQIISDSFRLRLEMMLRDVRVYGQLLAAQRRTDLTGTEPGFLARYRATK
jgi:FMN reductase